MDEITEQMGIAEELNTQSNLSWGQLFKTPAFRKRLFVGSFVWASAMLSGISFVQYFQTAIYATVCASPSLISYVPRC